MFLSCSLSIRDTAEVWVCNAWVDLQVRLWVCMHMCVRGHVTVCVKHFPDLLQLVDASWPNSRCVCVCERTRIAGRSLLLAHSQLVNTIWDTHIHAQRSHTYIIIITRGRKNSLCEKWQPNVMVDSLHIRRTDEALCECMCVCGFKRQ